MTRILLALAFLVAAVPAPAQERLKVFTTFTVIGMRAVS